MLRSEICQGNFICPVPLARGFYETGATMTDSIYQHGRLPSGVRRRIERLGPYQSLMLLAVPTCIVEPLKLIAVAVGGEGHWITGIIMVVGAYAASLLLVERLFRIVKPKLLTLPWFARLWNWFVAMRGKAVEIFHRA